MYCKKNRQETTTDKISVVMDFCAAGLKCLFFRQIHRSVGKDLENEGKCCDSCLCIELEKFHIAWVPIPMIYLLCARKMKSGDCYGEQEKAESRWRGTHGIIYA